MTLVTIQLPGQYTLSQLKQLFSNFSSAMKVVRAEAGLGRLSKVMEQPHEFAQFDTANPCANDSAWNERAVGVQKDTRPNLCEIRTLRLESLHPNAPPQD